MANTEQGHRAAIEAADRALAANPRDPGALIAKGDALAGLGDSRAAASFYSSALRAAGDGRGLAPAVIDDLRRAQAAVQVQAQRFEAHLTSSLAGAGFNPLTSSDRFALSLDLMAGRKRLYQQEPRFFLFPGLPQIQFQPRETLPWLVAVEAAASEIRAELDALLAEPDLFRPYVDPRSDRPNTDASGMLSNADWSALFLWKDGEAIHFKIKKNTQLKKLMDAYCARRVRTPTLCACVRFVRGRCVGAYRFCSRAHGFEERGACARA